MRGIAFKIAFVIGLVLAIQACYYEYPPEPSPIDPANVSFNTHILPILSQNCGTTQCHDQTHKPDMRDSIAYGNVSVAYRSLVLNNNYVNTTFPDESKLLDAIMNGVNGISMPDNGSLPQRDIEVIRAWMLKGAPND